MQYGRLIEQSMRRIFRYLEDTQEQLRRGDPRKVDAFFRDLEAEIIQSGNLERLDRLCYDRGDRYIDDRFVDDEMKKIVDMALRRLSSISNNGYYENSDDRYRDDRYRDDRYRDDRRYSNDGYRSFGVGPRAAVNPNNEIYVGAGRTQTYHRDDGNRFKIDDIKTTGYMESRKTAAVEDAEEVVSTQIKETPPNPPRSISDVKKSWTSPTGSEVLNYMSYKDDMFNEIAVGTMQMTAGVVDFEDLVAKLHRFVKDFEGKEFFIRVLHNEYVVVKAGDPEVYTSQKMLDTVTKGRSMFDYVPEVIQVLNNTKTRVARMWKQLIGHQLGKELLTGITYTGELHKRAIWLEDFDEVTQLLEKVEDEHSILFKYQHTPGYWEALQAAFDYSFRSFTDPANLLVYSEPKQFDEVITAIRGIGMELPNGVERYHAILSAMEKADPDKRNVYQDLAREIEKVLDDYVVFKVPRETFFSSICDVVGLAHGPTKIKMQVEPTDSSLGFFLDVSKRHIIKKATRDLIIAEQNLSYSKFTISYTVDDNLYLHYSTEPRISVEGRL